MLSAKDCADSISTAAMVGIMSAMMTTKAITTTVPDYSRKKRARKKSSSLPRTNEKSENVVIKSDIERSMTLLMELTKQSAKSRSYLRQLKGKNRANSSNFLLNNSRNGSSNFNNGNGNEDFVEGNIGISSNSKIEEKIMFDYQSPTAV